MDFDFSHVRYGRFGHDAVKSLVLFSFPMAFLLISPFLGSSGPGSGFVAWRRCRLAPLGAGRLGPAVRLFSYIGVVARVIWIRWGRFWLKVNSFDIIAQAVFRIPVQGTSQRG